jgi:hypothetical protein
MGNDDEALVHLWREKRGGIGPEDFSGYLGVATEELNRIWYEHDTGRRITDVQRDVKHSAISWRTVANELSMTLVVRRCFQCLAGKS